MPKRKLVLDEFEGSVIASVIVDGCADIVKVTEGSLEDALAQVPQLLTEAREKWAAEVTEPQAASAAVEPEPEVPPVAPAALAPTVSYISGEWEYYLQDGRGPFPDIQAAMDEMGLDKEKRPHHNRWDRLSSQLKDQIQRRPKA